MPDFCAKNECFLMNIDRPVLRFLCEQNAFNEPEFSELEWHSRGHRFDPTYLHHNARIRTLYIVRNVFAVQTEIPPRS